MHSARYFLGLLALCPLATIPLQGQTPDSVRWGELVLFSARNRSLSQVCTGSIFLAAI